jgi:hypothetical protein
MRLLPLALLACTYTAPDNPFAEPVPNVITGTVAVSDVEFTFSTMLLLTDADNPMPPSGLGSPETFTTVPGFEFTKGTEGTRSAPFAFTDVPDGSWVITGLMDGDRNFHPSVPTLAGATCRDVIGLFPDSLSSTELGVVDIAGGELVRDITVLLGRELTTSRPTFAVSDVADTIDPDVPFGVFRLESRPISGVYGELQVNVDGPFDGTDTCDHALWLHPRDVDQDGLPDPHPDYPPELGVVDIWPRVYLEWLGDPVDSTGDGMPDSFDRGQDTARYVTEGLPWFPQLVGGDPADLALIGRISPQQSLDVAFSGTFQRIDPDGTTTVVADGTQAPDGAWQVTVIAETGQTWTVPNELDTSMLLGALLPPPGVTSERDATQGTWVSFERL